MAGDESERFHVTPFKETDSFLLNPEKISVFFETKNNG